MIFEWPHPQIDEDWAKAHYEWREITPLAYRELKKAVPLRKSVANAFMQAEPVDILADGEGLYVCCKKDRGFYFAILLPGSEWSLRDYKPLPDTVYYLPNNQCR